MLTLRRAPRARVAVSATLGALEASAAFAFAHVLAGGASPGPLWLLAFGVLVYVGSRVVLRGQAPIRVVLPALVVAQVLGHAWLAALGPAAAHSGHGGHAVGATADSVALLGLSPTMVLAHVVAAVVTGVMWALRRRVVDVLVSWDDNVPALVAPRLRALVSCSRRATAARWLVITTPRRGPPAALFTRTSAPA